MSTDLSFKFSMCLPENNLQIITAINFKNSMMCNEINCGAKYHTLVHKSVALVHSKLAHGDLCVTSFSFWDIHTISDCPDFSVLSKAYHFSSTDQNGTYKQIQLDLPFHIAVSTF